MRLWNHVECQELRENVSVQLVGLPRALSETRCDLLSLHSFRTGIPEVLENRPVLRQESALFAKVEKPQGLKEGDLLGLSVAFAYSKSVWTWTFRW